MDDVVQDLDPSADRACAVVLADLDLRDQAGPFREVAFSAV